MIWTSKNVIVEPGPTYEITQYAGLEDEEQTVEEESHLNRPAQQHIGTLRWRDERGPRWTQWAPLPLLNRWT